MSNDVIAVAVGYNFGLIPSKNLDGIALKQVGHVRYENQNYDLFKAETYEDSRKIDVLLDQYGEHSVKEHEIEPVIMSSEVEMTVPGFDKDRDSLLFGGYMFVCNGKEIPVDFSGIAWSINQDGDKLSIPFITGKTGLATDCFLDDCYIEDYTKAGYQINDITAEFLSKATTVKEFMVSLELNEKEYLPEDIADIGRFEIKSLCFENDMKQYPVKQEVLDAFNEQINKKKSLAEQLQSAANRAETSRVNDTKAKDFTPEP